MIDPHALDGFEVFILGFFDPGPLMTIAIRCRGCGVVVSEQDFDAREAGEGDRASKAGIADTLKAKAHHADHLS